MAETVYLNGDWLPAEAAKVSVFDRGFLFADGIYEVVTVYAGQLFLLDRHLQRLNRSLSALGIANRSDSEWQQLFEQAIQKNAIADGFIYLQVTRGADTKRSHLPTGMLTPTVFISATHIQLPTTLPEPVRVCVMDDIRWLRCDIKSISLLGNILLKQQAVAMGGMEPLLHRAGRVTEGASCNYFIVKNGQLITPPKDQLILPGITRDWLVELARDHGIDVREEAFDLDTLYAADECFLTSSSREIQPVGWLDEHKVADGRPGAMTRQLAELFRANAPIAAAKQQAAG
ncbi:MAG: D-amino acid aminotransferase [Idiomarina sp.]